MAHTSNLAGECGLSSKSQSTPPPFLQISFKVCKSYLSRKNLWFRPSPVSKCFQHLKINSHYIIKCLVVSPNSSP